MDFHDIYETIKLKCGEFLAKHHILLKGNDEKSLKGSFFTKKIHSDFLLVVSTDKIKNSAKKEDFYSNDWSYAWINFLGSEVGPHSLCDISSLSHTLIDKKNILIISKSAVNDISGEKIGLLSDFTDSGGLLIIDLPSNKLKNLTELKIEKQQKAHQITYISPVYLEKKYINILKEMPLNTSILQVQRDKNTDVIMEIDGFPAICHTKRKGGDIISILFDYPLQAVSIQQGIPTRSDYTIEKKDLKSDLPIGSIDMAMEGINKKYPSITILNRLLFNIITEYYPLPRWYYCPRGYSGTFIMSHDEDFFGDRLRYMIDYELDKNITPTLFVISYSKISSAFLNDLAEKGVDIGIHWYRSPYPIAKFRIGHIPVRKIKTMLEQRNSLLKKVRREIISSRNHALAWDSHYTNTCRVLAADGVRIDSTYGWDMYNGYFFGTCMPFIPIDTNGAPFTILEVPFTIYENNGGLSEPSAEYLITGNASSFHGVTVALFHPHHSLKGGTSRKIWLESIELAKKENLWTTNFREYYIFWTKRSKSDLSSHFDRNKKTLSINCIARREDLALIIPYKYETWTVSNTLLDGEKKDHEYIKILDRNSIIFSVPVGEHSIVVCYGGHYNG